MVIQINLTKNQLLMLIHHLKLSLPEIDEYIADDARELIELCEQLEKLHDEYEQSEARFNNGLQDGIEKTMFKFLKTIKTKQPTNNPS